MTNGKDKWLFFRNEKIAPVKPPEGSPEHDNYPGIQWTYSAIPHQLTIAAAYILAAFIT